MVSENLRRVLFGEQKQALRQNTAVLELLEDYFIDCATWRDTPEHIIETIENEITFLARKYQVKANSPDYMLLDKVIIELIVGVEGWEAIHQGVPGVVVHRSSPSTGKVTFNFVTESEVQPEEIMSYLGEEFDKKSNLESEAWKLVNDMVGSVAPSYRSSLPEDDRLAAILLSRDYWTIYG